MSERLTLLEVQCYTDKGYLIVECVEDVLLMQEIFTGIHAEGALAPNTMPFMRLHGS